MDFATKIAQQHAQNLYRTQKKLTSAQGCIVEIAGKKLINFSSNDYLSLANHEQVKIALIKAIEKYGVGSGASHLISGHFDAHQQLETELAQYCGQKKSALFSSGYLANLGVFSALKDEISWTLQDRLNHASLLDGSALLGLRCDRYAHNDYDAIVQKLQKYPNSTGLIASDVVFSMDGDVANTQQLQTIAKQTNNYLLLDNAHGFGVLPSISHANNLTIQMATLGKAVGCSGAFVTGDVDFIDYLTQKSRPFIYTTALPPALCVASLASLDIIKTGKQQQKLQNNIDYFKNIAKQKGLNFLPSNTAIQPLIIGDNAKTMQIQESLQNAGFLVGAIRTPTVPKNSARLRITLNADHTQNQIEKLLNNVV